MEHCGKQTCKLRPRNKGPYIVAEVLKDRGVPLHSRLSVSHWNAW